MIITKLLYFTFMNVNKNINYLSLKIWLLTIYVLVSLIVFVGGFTRLTESGLSITVWEVFKGILPPLNIDEWNVYFNLYKQIPEYKVLNSGMTLSEFKTIFYWEYGHRLIARLIGLICIIPLLYFTFVYKDFFKIFKKYYLLFFLILIQGIIGWYMVKSGLDKNLDVSHFRLSIHLSLALIILSFSFLFFLELSNIKKYSYKIPKKLINLILFFLVIQIILGAFLAGLNGGLIYNTWPDMSGSFFPNDSVLNDYLSLSSFSDPSIVQFFHRTTAYILLIFVILLNIYFYKYKLNPTEILIFDLSIFIQIFLGIVTLLNGVVIKYASLHQIGSIFVLSSFLFIYFKNCKS